MEGGTKDAFSSSTVHFLCEQVGAQFFVAFGEGATTCGRDLPVASVVMSNILYEVDEMGNCTKVDHKSVPAMDRAHDGVKFPSGIPRILEFRKPVVVFCNDVLDNSNTGTFDIPCYATIRNNLVYKGVCDIDIPYVVVVGIIEERGGKESRLSHIERFSLMKDVAHVFVLNLQSFFSEIKEELVE